MKTVDMKAIKLKDFYKEIQVQLQSDYEQEELDVMIRWLFEYYFATNATDFLLNKAITENLQPIYEAIERLKKKEPIQYILGESYFLGKRFVVSRDVLIPRPETEELVQHIYQQHQETPPQKILDIGTGSGCIAISLALRFPKAAVWALDVSSDALAIAQENATMHSVSIKLLHQDILQWQPATHEKWSIMVSNPPYIRLQEQTTMRENVLLYEPHQALFVSDADPLIFYRRIAQLATHHLEEGGYLYFEINQAFGKEMLLMLQEMDFKNIKIYQDLYGNDRFVECQYKSSKFISK
jgi:release factor glutamine methyltransferase